MAFNMNMNNAIRKAGKRSSGLDTPAGGPPPGLPNIGQTPAVQAADLVLSQTAQAQPQPQPMPAAQPTPMAAPPVQPATFTMSPAGQQADPNAYNYEPQPDGSWRVYPPGVQAPGHMLQASMPRAASTGDYRRLRTAFQQPQF